MNCGSSRFARKGFVWNYLYNFTIDKMAIPVSDKKRTVGRFFHEFKCPDCWSHRKSLINYIAAGVCHEH